MFELRWIYKVIRTILFSAVILTGSLFVSVYLILSIPPVQNYIREIAQEELTKFLGGEVEIGSLNIAPFNEVLLKDVAIKDLEGKKCLQAAELGAGINFWRLILSSKIEITYIDLLDFDIDIYQKKKDGPLNIAFIIEALSPKDKNKPPTVFDLKIHNVVLRNGSLCFSKLWEKRGGDPQKIDFNYLTFDKINADLTLPKLTNDYFEIDLRRLTLRETSGLDIEDFSGFFIIKPHEFEVKNLRLDLPSNKFTFPDFSYTFNELKNIGNDFKTRDYDLAIENLNIVPCDFAPFFPELRKYTDPVAITIDVNGNLNNFNIRKLILDASQFGINLNLTAHVENITEPKELEILLDNLDLNINSKFPQLLFTYIEPDEKVKNMIVGAGDIKGNLKGVYSAKGESAALSADLSTLYGDVQLDVKGLKHDNLADLSGKVSIPGFEIGKLLDSQDVNYIHNADLTFDLRNLGEDPKLIEGSLDAKIGQIGLLKREFENIDIQAFRQDSDYELQLEINDDDLQASLNGKARLKDADSHIELKADIRKFDTYTSFLTSEEKKFELSGKIEANVSGNNIENAVGFVNLEDFTFISPGAKPIHLNQLKLKSDFEDDGSRLVTLNTDFVDVSIEGNFNPMLLPNFAYNELKTAIPSLLPGEYRHTNCGSGKFYIDFADAKTVIDLLKLPIDPLTQVILAGDFNSEERTLNFSTEIPYIVQNENKLIRDSYFGIKIDGKEGLAQVVGGTIYPTKKGDLKVDLNASALKDHYNLLIDFNEGLDTSFYGSLSLGGDIEKNELLGGYDINFNVNPTSLFLNDAEWKVGAAEVEYTDKTLAIRDFSIRHDDQFVLIDGVSGKNDQQFVEVQLADIDLSYIFDTLNINYVTFGGKATGDIVATELFSGNPMVHTRFLDIKNLSYNGAVLGDGKITSSLDLPSKKVNIHADISEAEREVAVVDGGVWIGKDSLSFNFNTDKVDIRFLKPFMKAFTSDVRGRATGDVTLYGTFKDINMKGKVFADEISLLVDYTNVRYSGSDSVIIDPGEIRIPNFRLKDKFGNTAVLNGVVRHTYFHQPEFDFDVTNIDKMLVYDTNSKMNPIWYGTIFGSGTAKIEGKPGYVNILADMTTDKQTVFTFVLSDEQQAEQSKFLTFSDKRKEALTVKEEEIDTVPDFLKRFQKTQHEEEQGEPDVFSLDLRADITPDAELILVMDPVAGDKIKAYGNGAMNITYDSQSDDMRMFGKYILDRGTYNFSLQDIILKEFTIKPGSSISFTGNPYSGDLDITAAYRVNTSLTELDKSFSSDRELNRTNVPVEALLKVRGLMTNPDISFDIDLPTVTEETARKVKSIISTEDMMNRQVIYLVALNKFYSPEYMGVSSTGGEWASIASSTLSSQIQNMIGQVTDKFTFAPSLRSDKGDFSDLEFDIALSSSLFNNRLLLNGNLGYRDPSTSNTTFVGDFDIEYLLTKKGNLRLKAYNHFNDQNYYLKSALTTQGIGVVWRMDFDDLQQLFNRSRKEKKDSLPLDTLSK